MIKILSAGALSTIQDKGRFGGMKYGFTQCGAMDSFSFRLANKIVGNDDFSPAVEMTMLGITAKFTDDYVICVSGGEFDVTLNDIVIRQNKAYHVKDGDVLRIGVAKSGLRSYLAIGGRIKAQEVMGSVSTDLKSAIGGIRGRRLMVGDVLEIENKAIPDNVDLREYELTSYDKIITVRAVRGPQDHMFTVDDLKRFFNQQYTVTKDIDRMGIRLYGCPLESKNGFDIISDAISFGSVQVPKSGQPIVLMADHQTTGGYAKIATVISVDLPRLAQLRQGNKIIFEEVTAQEAERLEREQTRFFANLRW